MRVSLRAPDADDADALAAVRADPTVCAWWGEPDEPGDDVTVLAIDVDGTIAGAVHLWEDDDPDYRHGGIDIFLGSAFQGRGVGPEALRLAVAVLMEERGHHRVTIDPAAANTAAIRCYEKAGFRPVGVLRRSERGPDGTWHDQLLMELVRDP